MDAGFGLGILIAIFLKFIITLKQKAYLPKNTEKTFGSCIFKYTIDWYTQWYNGQVRVKDCPSWARLGEKLF